MTACGTHASFSPLSSFSSAYRSAFGESPNIPIKREKCTGTTKIADKKIYGLSRQMARIKKLKSLA